MTRTAVRAGIAGFVFVLTASLAGCFAPAGGGDPSSEPTSTETSTTVVEPGLDVPIRVEQAEGVGELTISNPTFNVDAPGGLPYVPEGDHGILIIDAAWTTLEGSTDMVPFYWMVRDPAGVDGIHYFFVDEAFSEIGVRAGETITGQIGFEISPGPYTFIVFDDGIQEIARFTFEAQPRESDGVRS